MILVVDVGNTNIVLGVYDDKQLVADWRFSTDTTRTADEYGIQVVQLFKQKHLETMEIEGVIISSVVPSIMYTLEHMIRKYFEKEPMIVGNTLNTGINIMIDNPKEVGADRIVNAVAAHDKFHNTPLIIIDFGTATTFCALTEEGDYLGGVICPGLKISANALFEKAAKLPKVELIRPESIIGKNTVSSMQSGIVFGYIGQVEYIVEKIKKEMLQAGTRNPYVVATGGLAKLIAKDSTSVDRIEPFLTLDGLRIIYEKNRSNIN